MNIYIIEDDKMLRSELKKLLNNNGFSCSFDDNYENIVNLALNSNTDLILLDINLPVIDGFNVCQEIRKKSEVPIIIVTSRNTDIDEFSGISFGADDFITKPYNVNILLARINSILKRTSNNQNKISYNGLLLDMNKSNICYNNKCLELTKNECRILSVLIENNNIIVSRDLLMNELWQSDQFIDDNTLTVNVTRLRNKLCDIGLSNFIKTKRGQGYII